jgi:hypothetical protein
MCAVTSGDHEGHSKIWKMSQVLARWSFSGVACIIAALCCTPACAANFTVREAAQACSGIASVEVKSKGADIKYENYSLTVGTTGTLTVKQAGVLLKKIDSFNYSDYTGCVIDLTKTMIGIAAPTQRIPVDIFDKVRIGEAGRTSLGYFTSLFGPPTDTVDDDDGRKIAKYLSDGYIIRVQYLPGEQNRVVALKVTIDDPSNPKRGQIVLGGYWGGAKPGSVLGVTTWAKGFDGNSCNPTYGGGLLVNRDPIFRCTHDAPHSEGFVGFSVEMRGADTNDGNTYDLFRLSDEYNNQDPGSSPLDKETKKRLEKIVDATKSDIPGRDEQLTAAILESFGPHVVTGFAIFNSLSGSPIEDDDN